MRLLDAIIGFFGCRHTLSWPFKRDNKWPCRYQACTKCGTEFEYRGGLK